MVELLYTPVFPCEDGVKNPPKPYEDLSCDEYTSIIAEDMQDMSFKVAYGCLATIAASLVGNVSNSAVA